jgi:hypothetical protein
MKSSQPPALATWWLEHLRFGVRNDFLIGDLVEEYGRGRSRAWYWKQVVAAFVLNFGREVRTHPLLAARAAASVWSVWYLYGFVFSSSLHKLTIPLPPAIGFMWLLFGCGAWAGAGWIVARIHGEHKTTMVLVFAISVLFWKLPWFYHVLIDTLRNVRYGPYLLNDFLDLVLTSVSILLGGFSNSFPRNAAPTSNQLSVHVESQDQLR